MNNIAQSAMPAPAGLRESSKATVEEKAAKLGQFLKTHQKLDPEARAKLVDYLVGLPRP